MDLQIARHNMVNQQVRTWNVSDARILDTLNSIEREHFVPPEYSHLAYCDSGIPLGHDQFMLAPKVVGRALQALELKPTDSVLEIGTGTGYVTAALSKLSKQVISLEILPDLAIEAKANLSNAAWRNIQILQQDGVMGLKSESPFDAICVTGSYPLGIPKELCYQLEVNGGRLFAITGTAPIMQAIKITRISKDEFTTESLFETVVPALINAKQDTSFDFN